MIKRVAVVSHTVAEDADDTQLRAHVQARAHAHTHTHAYKYTHKPRMSMTHMHIHWQRPWMPMT